MVGARLDGLGLLGITMQLVRDHVTWFAIGSNQSAEETFCDLGIAARLNHNEILILPEPGQSLKA